MTQRAYIFWAVFVAAAIMRLVISSYRTPADALSCLHADARGVGTIAEDPSTNAKGQIFVVRADRIIANGEACASDINVRIATSFYPRYAYGSRIVFAGTLAQPRDFASDNGRTFDYSGYLAKDDIYYEMRSAHISFATSTADTSSDPGLWPQWIDVSPLLFGLKRAFVSHLDQSLGEPHAALAAGLVVGEKSALGKDLLDDFRIVGLIHIVVLSGFNITIVGVALRRVLSFLPRVWGIVIGGIGIALFGVLVGGGATVIRSCFMAGVAIIADIIRRDYSVARALAFAALVMLIQNPLILLHDPSFQLSFLATLGLILLASPIESRLGWIPDKFGMRGTVASCFATQIFVSPFILYMMGQISLIGVIVNILVLPFIPATMLVVFLAGSLGFIHPMLSIVAGWGAHLLLSYELWMVTHFARIPYAALQVPPFSGWWVAGFYGVFFLLYFSLSSHNFLKTSRMLWAKVASWISRR
jgi:competence protein ComEC